MGLEHPTAEQTSTALNEQPTRVRYGVLSFLCALTFVLYIDRICISQAGTRMQAEFGISDTRWGIVLNAFLLAYGLFEVPTGRWGDKYGSRGVLLRIVLWWSVFTALTGCVLNFSFDLGWGLEIPGTSYAIPLLFDSFLLLLVVRFLFGAGEAGALPNAARVVTRWFPPGRRGPAQGLINTFMLVGGALTPVVVAYIMKLAGWRVTFVLFGGLGVVWAVAFYLWYRDDPAEHPGVNQAELQLIGSGSERTRQGHHPPIPWRLVLTNANVWLLGGVITCSAFNAYINYGWYPTYLKKGRGVEELMSGWLASWVLGCGAVGCMLGGFLSDWMARWTGEKRWSRRLVGASGLAVAALAQALSTTCELPDLAATCTGLAAFCTGCTLATWWAVVIEISGKHLGALFGLMNSLGVPGAFASQQLFGSLADWLGERGYEGRDRWDPGFLVAAIVLAIGAVGWLFIDASRPIEHPEDEGRETTQGG